MITPDLFGTILLSDYPEVRLAFARRKTIGCMIDTFNPEAIHIAMESAWFKGGTFIA